MVKNGIQKGRQRFKCFGCGHTFQNKQRHTARNTHMMHRYVLKRQTLKDIGEEYGKGSRWAQRHIGVALATLQKDISLKERSCTFVADCTFFTRSDGIIVFKDVSTKECVYVKEIISESPRHYAEARTYLAQRGINVKGIVLDGRMGVRDVFKDIPVQMCHFHQVAIITRYLTRRPKLEAGQELRIITRTLTKTNEIDFRIALTAWHERWKNFLAEKTFHEGGRGWSYTHRRIRSAHRSLMTNLPFLFIHKAHPELSLPNTTNSLDGLFSHLKHLLLVHRGMSKQKRWRLIQLILKKKI